jgi:hypothetical protein
MTHRGPDPVRRAKVRPASRDRLRFLARLAELQAEVARRPLVIHQKKASKLKDEIQSLAETRQDFCSMIDDIASGVAPLHTAAYLAARSEDLRLAQAYHYQTLARVEAEMVGSRDMAARARARADVLARLSR